MTETAFIADILNFNSHDQSDHQARLLRDGLLLVESGRITALGPAAQLEASLPSGTQVIRDPGKTLAPGFFDAHPHFPHPKVRTFL
jgi:cytosine/adenosine deaminase-related metal-dependent hydrolase